MIDFKDSTYRLEIDVGVSTTIKKSQVFGKKPNGFGGALILRHTVIPMFGRKMVNSVALLILENNEIWRRLCFFGCTAGAVKHHSLSCSAAVVPGPSRQICAWCATQWQRLSFCKIFLHSFADGKAFACFSNCWTVNLFSKCWGLPRLVCSLCSTGRGHEFQRWDRWMLVTGVIGVISLL